MSGRRSRPAEQAFQWLFVPSPTNGPDPDGVLRSISACSQGNLRLDRRFFMGGAFGIQLAWFRLLALGAVAAAVDAFDHGGHAHGLLDARQVFGIVHIADLQQHPVGKGAQKRAPFLRGQVLLRCAVIERHPDRMHREIGSGDRLSPDWPKAVQIDFLNLLNNGHQFRHKRVHDASCKERIAPRLKGLSLSVFCTAHCQILGGEAGLATFSVGPVANIAFRVDLIGAAL